MATNYVSDKAKSLWLNASINMGTDAGIKLMLCTSAYSPAKANDFATSATASEISTTNYAGGYGGGGRIAVSGKAVTEDTTNHWGKFTFSAATWTNLGPASGGPVTAYALLIQETGGSDATAPILATYDVVYTTNGGNLTLTPAANGAIQIT